MSDRVAILCDTHFGVKGDSKVFLDHQERFFRDIFFPYLEANEITTILHLGDVFDRRKNINFYTFSRVKEFFLEKLVPYDFHAVVGNHDTFFTNTNEVNSPALLLGNFIDPSQVYVNEPKELKFGKTKVIMCPWLTRENTEQCLSTVAKSKAHILMGHFEMKGFEFLKGIKSEHGLDAKLFRNFEGVYSGHFHHQSKQANIHYLGTPYQMTWADFGETKGFHVLNTNTRDLEFIPNPHDIFHKIIYDGDDTEIPDLDNSYVRLVVKDRGDLSNFEQYISKLNDSGAVDIKVIEDPSLIIDSVGDLELDETITTQEFLHQYIDQVETKVDKTKIKIVIDELYKKALAA
ncbi:MAG: metallophosphoesterase [Anaerolineaceae bacterium]